MRMRRRHGHGEEPSLPHRPAHEVGAEAVLEGDSYLVARAGWEQERFTISTMHLPGAPGDLPEPLCSLDRRLIRQRSIWGSEAVLSPLQARPPFALTMARVSSVMSSQRMWMMRRRGRPSFNGLSEGGGSGEATSRGRSWA